MNFRIISIGTLSRHPLWDTPSPQRTAHATTTLITTDDDRRILVDPALPDRFLDARLQERIGYGLDRITDVFLTCYRPAHRAGLPALEHADWYIAEPERERIGVQLIAQLDQGHDADVRELIQRDIAMLQRCKPAPDQLAERVDLFPVPGYTPGTCGLLLAMPAMTVVVAGDAVATSEHLEAGQLLPGPFDLDAAHEAFKDVIEIADWIIPGHDNLIPNPTRRPF